MTYIKPAASLSGTPTRALEQNRLRHLALLDRWDLLGAVKAARHDLEIGEREIAVLQAHLSSLPKGPLRTDEPNFSFMKVQKLADRASCMDERTFRRGEARLIAAGLIRRNLSANGRRYPRRTASGQLITAYGIDLSPLLHRAAELHALAELARSREIERRDVISQIRAELAQAARHVRDTSTELLEGLLAHTAVIRRILRRKTTSIGELHQLHEEVRKISHDLSQSTMEDFTDRSKHPDCADISSASASEMQTAMTTTRETGHDSPPVRHIESHEREYTEREKEALLVVEVDEAWLQSPTIQSILGTPPRNGGDLGQRLRDFARWIGISSDHTSTAIRALGLGRCIRTLDYIASRIDVIRNPGGYLLSICRRETRNVSIRAGMPGW